MKILFITPTLPTRLSRIRAYNILKYLSKKHELHLLSFIDSQKKAKKIDDIRKFCASVETVLLPKYRSYLSCLLHLFTRLPLRAAYYKSEKMRDRIKTILAREDFDLIYIKRERMAQYGEVIDSVPKVLDLTDALSLYYKRAIKKATLFTKLFYLQEYLRIFKYETEVSKKFDKTVFCSPIDLEFLRKNSLNPLNNLTSVPIGVDTEFYHPSGLSVEENSILFSGVMGAFPNIDAARYLCREIFPLIQEKIPNVKLYIVGPQPPNSIRRFARGSQIIVTGFVDDIRDYIERAAVIVCPIRVGAGSRNKIYQALAIKKAVVSTSIGAEGLEVVPDEHILIADDPKEFAAKTVRLLKDKELRARLGQKGYELIKSKYSLEQVAEQMNCCLEEAVAKQRGLYNG